MLTDTFVLPSYTWFDRMMRSSLKSHLFVVIELHGTMLYPDNPYSSSRSFATTTPGMPKRSNERFFPCGLRALFRSLSVSARIACLIITNE